MKFKKILFCLLFFLVGAFLLLQIDDPLNEEAVAWIESVDYQTPNESYYYFLGLNVASEHDPLEFGKEKITEIRDWEVQHEFCTDGGRAPYKINPEKLLIKDVFSQLLEKQQDYIKAITNKDFVTSLTESEKLFLERFRVWLSLKPFKSMQCPNFILPLANYSNLTFGNRLHLLNIASLFARGDYPATKEAVEKNTDVLLDKIANADALFAKAAFHRMLNDHLDLIAVMAQKQPSIFSKIKIDKQQLLNPELIFKEQLLDVYNADRTAQKIGALLWPFGPEKEFWEPVETIKVTPKWLYKTLYKPNMNFNKTYADLKELIDKSQMNINDYYSFRRSGCNSRECRWSFLDKLRNYGFYKNRSLHEFTLDRAFDLLVKIELVNSIIKNNALLEKSLINPYTGENDVLYDEKRKRICFSSSAPHTRLGYPGNDYSCVYKIDNKP